MFKRVHVASLRPGVFLHKLDAPWLTHGIWRQRFPVRDHRDAERIRKSGAVYCWIDLRKGIDPSVPHTSAAPEGSPATMAGALESPVPGAVVAAPPARDMASELSRAESICARGRKRVADLFSQARLGRAIEVAQCEDLVDDIAQSVARHAGALQSLVRMKSKDDYTFMHSLGVCTMMIALGRQMGLDEQTCRQAGLGGLLHDVGKARTPVDILNKAGPLSQEEFAIVKAHPLDGYNMLESIGVTVGMPALDVILHHHEHVDGGGYPHDLKLPELSLLARMGAICDVYDALTSERPYKTAWDPAESLARMASWRGKLDRPSWPSSCSRSASTLREAWCGWSRGASPSCWRTIRRGRRRRWFEPSSPCAATCPSHKKPSTCRATALRIALSAESIAMTGASRSPMRSGRAPWESIGRGSRHLRRTADRRTPDT